MGNEKLKNQPEEMIPKILDVLSRIDLTQWYEEKPYQEIVHDRHLTHLSVHGFKTTLDLPDYHFVVWLENTAVVSPDPTSSPREAFISPYRIRIARDEEGKRVDIGGFISGGRDQSRAEELYLSIADKITESRIVAEEKADKQLLVDFDNAISVAWQEPEGV